MKTKTFVRSSLIAASCGVSLLISASAHAQLTPVDLELSLLIDASGSISSSDFQTQIDAYESVFNDPTLFTNFISQGSLGQIAVNVVKFGSSANEDVPFTLIDSVAASQAFAASVGAVNQSGVGFTTSITDGINTALASVNNNTFDGTQITFDISTDGSPNNQSSAAAAAANALNSGVDAINALAIGSGANVSFLQSSLIGGTNSNGSPAFVVTANSFGEVQTALTNKIQQEVGGGNGGNTTVPEPASIAALLAVGALGGASKLKRNNKEA